MKIFTKMAAIVLACVLAVPGEARVNGIMISVRINCIICLGKGSVWMLRRRLWKRW